MRNFIVKRLLKCASLILALPITLDSYANSSGALKFSGGLFDSEMKDGVLFTPAAEITAETSTTDKLWKATAQIKTQTAQNTQKLQGNSQLQTLPTLETLVTQANVGRFEEWYHARLGRMVLRPTSVSLNEAAKQFMRNPIATDGLEVVSALENFELGAFAGTAQSFGALLGARLQYLQAGITYRYQSEKLVSFPATNTAGDIAEASKITALHEAELTLKVPGNGFVSESVLQFTREGPYSEATILDANTQERTVGAEDTTLPFEANDYRASTQLKYKTFESDDTSDWAVFSLGSRTMPRYHKGNAEEKTFRQSSGTDLRFASGYEVVSKSFSAQIVLYSNFSSSAKYRIFAKRNNIGEPELSKSKFGLTLSTTFNF